MRPKFSELVYIVHSEKLILNINSRFFFPEINQIASLHSFAMFYNLLSSLCLVVLVPCRTLSLSLTDFYLSSLLIWRLVSVKTEMHHLCRLLPSCQQLLASEILLVFFLLKLPHSQPVSLEGISCPVRMLDNREGFLSSWRGSGSVLQPKRLAGIAHCLAAGDDTVCLTYGAVSN